MSVFVDTSALLAVLDADEATHQAAAARWRALLDAGDPLMTTNYVLVERVALIQRRLGMEAVRVFDRDVAPVLHVFWIDEIRHRTAMTALATASRRDLSLVDCASFDAMREHAVTRAFAFDRHFADQNFDVLG